MKHIPKRFYRRALLILAMTAMTGCAQNAPTPYKDARHYVIHNMSELNGNYRIDVNGTVKQLEPTFKKFYELGKSDKQSGITITAAGERAKGIIAAQMQHREAETSYTPAPQARKGSETLDEREARAFGEALAGVYLDGFNGN